MIRGEVSGESAEAREFRGFRISQWNPRTRGERLREQSREAESATERPKHEFLAPTPGSRKTNKVARGGQTGCVRAPRAPEGGRLNPNPKKTLTLTEVSIIQHLKECEFRGLPCQAGCGAS